MIESFDVQRSAARRYIHDAIDLAAAADITSHIPGTRTRKVKVACLVEGQTTDRAALPAWVLAYRYRDSPYRAIVHGQRADIVFGTSPIDWGKVLRLVGGAVAVIVAAIALAMLVGCGGSKKVDPDAPNYVPVCVPTPPSFTPLTGTAAVLGTLNVHVDAGGLIMVDTTSTLLLELSLTQTGTTVAVMATACSIHIPDVPLAGQDMPIQFEVPDATLTSVGIVTANATLSSADATCANLDTDPITLVLGARLDPTMIQTEPLPAADGSGNFVTCAGDPGATCATATGTGCACDQEGDGKPGATLIAHNVPAVKLDEVYATLRTTFSLHGQVWSGDLVEGTVDASLDTGVLGCLEMDGSLCIGADLHAVQALNPVVSQQPTNPSIFQSVRVPDGTTCDEIIANQAAIFSN